jgi:Kef-type K+ transport system membrane component KefB
VVNMVEGLFIQLSAILGVALLVSLAVRAMKQPAVIGYILTGIIVGPAFLGLVHAGDGIDVFGQLGVAFLLFIVGLGLRPKLIRDVGTVSLRVGIGQILLTTALGYVAAHYLGYATTTALYLGFAFALSSTIVVLQLLYAKEEEDALHGRITIGILLVQDFAAMLAFLVLTSVQGSADLGMTILTLIIKIVVMVIAVYVLTTAFVPHVEAYFAKSREVLFLFALAVCFAFAAGFTALGFSQELGALLAGVLLSMSPYQRDISLRLYPLRDFFLMMFFVVLGTHIVPQALLGEWRMLLVFSAIVLIGKPLITLLIMRPLSYTLHTSLATGTAIAQVSEFSLILIGTGVAIGQVPASVLGSVTAVSLFTIFVSSYSITHHAVMYRRAKKLLHRIFGPDRVSEKPLLHEQADVILFGCHRLGSGIVQTLYDLNAKFVVVDHDPEIIRHLKSTQVPHILGSADDIGLLERLPMAHVKTIICTIPDIETARSLVERTQRVNQDAVILCVAYHHDHARELYQAGATYVIVPPYLGRRYIVNLLRHYRFDPFGYRQERSIHEQELRET